MVRLNLPEGEFAKLNKMLKTEANMINKNANEGLYRVAMNVLADSQANLRKNGSLATSKLINSGSVEKQPDNTVDVVYDANYAFWVEHGRESGTPPPYKPILEWIKKKGSADIYNIKTHKRASRGAAKDYTNKKGKIVKQGDFYKRAIGMAIAIAKSIGRKGTKAKPFLFPAFRKNESDMLRVIKNAVRL